MDPVEITLIVLLVLAGVVTIVYAGLRPVPSSKPAVADPAEGQPADPGKAL